MQSLIYHAQVVVKKNGTFTLHDLPLKGGQYVEVVIYLSDLQMDSDGDPFVLRKEPLKDVEPFSPIALDTWAVS
jgi:hypothetical protein